MSILDINRPQKAKKHERFYGNASSSPFGLGSSNPEPVPWEERELPRWLQAEHAQNHGDYMDGHPADRTVRRHRRAPVENKLSRYLRPNIVPRHLRNNWGYHPTDFYIGISVASLRLKLQARIRGKFQWSGLGKEWDIGHRVDLCHFDLTELLQVRMAWHWTNLIPIKSGTKIRQPNRERLFLEKNRLYNEVRNADAWKNPGAVQLEEWEKPGGDMVQRPLWAFCNETTLINQ